MTPPRAQAIPPMLTMVDLIGQQAPQQQQLNAELLRVVASGRYVLGEEVSAFERALAEYLETPHAVAVGSGTDALMIALRCAGVLPGDVVVTTPFTFAATAEAVLRCGAQLRFVDIDEATLNLCVDSLERYVNGCVRRDGRLYERDGDARLAAVLPVHLFGRVADVARLSSYCAKGNVALVHDSAQAIGARASDGRPLAVSGPSCLSFFPTKNLGAWGDGGALLFNDEPAASRAKRLRQHGRDERGRYSEVGYNSRLDALQAAVLRQKLTRLDTQQQQRRAVYGHYLHHFIAASVHSLLRLPAPLRAHDVAHMFTLRVLGGEPSRQRLQQHLQQARIESRVYYAQPLHREPAYRSKRCAPFLLPVAERASQQVLSLPSHPGMREADVVRVVRAIVQCLQTD